MRTIRQALSIATLAATALVGSMTVSTVAHAENGPTVTCNDGSSSKAGKGACSHHGGVNQTEQVTCKDGSTGKAGKGACSHHGGVSKPENSPSAPK